MNVEKNPLDMKVKTTVSMGSTDAAYKAFVRALLIPAGDLQPHLVELHYVRHYSVEYADEGGFPSEFMEFISSDHISPPYAPFVHFFILDGNVRHVDRHIGSCYSVLREQQSTSKEVNESLSQATGRRTNWKGDILIVQHSLHHPTMLTSIERSDIQSVVSACAATASFGFSS